MCAAKQHIPGIPGMLPWALHAPAWTRVQKNLMLRYWVIFAVAVRWTNHFVHRTDHRCPLHDLDFSRQIDSWSLWSSSCCQVGAISSEWSRTCFLGWICTIQILHNISGGLGSRRSRSWSVRRVNPFTQGKNDPSLIPNILYTSKATRTATWWKNGLRILCICILVYIVDSKFLWQLQEKNQFSFFLARCALRKIRNRT